MKIMKKIFIFTALFCLTGCFSEDQLENKASAPSNEGQETSSTSSGKEESSILPPPSNSEDQSFITNSNDNSGGGSGPISVNPSLSDETSTEGQSDAPLALTYNQKAEYITLYSNCINCHNDQLGIDFGDVDVSISSVEVAYSDFNIDSNTGEDAIVDAAISSLVDLYRTEGNGGPFNRTGNDAIGTNMSSKSGIGHTSEQKANIDILEEWIKSEHNL